MNYDQTLIKEIQEGEVIYKVTTSSSEENELLNYIFFRSQSSVSCTHYFGFKENPNRYECVDNLDELTRFVDSKELQQPLKFCTFNDVVLTETLINILPF